MKSIDLDAKSMVTDMDDFANISLVGTKRCHLPLLTRLRNDSRPKFRKVGGFVPQELFQTAHTRR
jgi:hypothetical protein